MDKSFLAIILIALSINSYGKNLADKLGIGMTNHLIIGLPSISLKYRKDESSALGAHIGVDSNSDNGKYALGFKYYKVIFKENNLDFYSSLGLSAFTTKVNQEDEAGYQFDWVFGTEFSFQGLESLGFSLEFGLSALNYLDKTSIQTTGNNILQAAVHFYL